MKKQQPNCYFPLVKTVIFLLVCWAYQLKAQHTVDSLRQEVNKHTGDTNEVNATYMLARYTKANDTEKALTLAGQALALAKTLGYTSGKIYSYNTVGIILQDKGEYNSALAYLDTSLQMATEEKDSLAMGITKNNIGLIYLEQGMYEQSLTNLLEAATIRSLIGDKRGEAGSYNNIGLMYSYTGQHAKAIEYYTRSLPLKQELGDEQGAANTYLNIGLSYGGLKDTVQERSNYRKALEIFLRTDDKKGQSMVYNNFGEIFSEEKSYAKALSYHEAAYQLRREQQDIIGQAQSGTNIAACLIQIGRGDEAEPYIQRSVTIANQENDMRELARAYGVMSDLQASRGEYEEALSTYKMSANLLDSILNKENAQHLQEMEAKYSSEKKEKEILQLQAAAVKAEYKKNMLITISAGILILLSVAGWFIFLRYKARHQQLRELAVLETKQSERVRIARDMHDDIGSGLTRISFLSEQLRMELSEAAAGDGTIERLSKLTTESRQLTGNLGEIIWTMSPKNDTLEGLTSYLRNFAYDYLEQAGIECKVKFPMDIPDVAMTAEFRRNIFLCLKESLNNAVKYSQCSQVFISLDLHADRMSLTIGDNGKGFPASSSGLGGNGLINIRNRARECGGNCTIESVPGQGVAVILHDIPLVTTKM